MAEQVIPTQDLGIAKKLRRNVLLLIVLAIFCTHELVRVFLIGIAIVVLEFELRRMIDKVEAVAGRFDIELWSIFLGVCVIASYWLPLWLALVIILCAAGTSFVWWHYDTRWVSLNTAYLATAGVLAIDLLQQPQGFGTFLWIVAIVADTDTGAQIVGKRIRGKKLCPSISPDKRWSGAVGGLLAAIVAAVVITIGFGHSANIIAIAAIAASLSIVAQLGDLLESYVKRQFDTKDIANWLPGVGGLYDRADGYIAVFTVSSLLNKIQHPLYLW